MKRFLVYMLVLASCPTLLVGALVATSPVSTHAAAKGPIWHVQPGPNPGAWNNTLNGVAALSSTDIWAVGDYTNTQTDLPTGFIAHWDGTAWSIVSSPTPANNDLRGIVALSPTDAWAVGGSVIEHWDGSAWSIAFDNPNWSFSAIAAVSANDIWAVEGPFTLHWDGSAWNYVYNPGTGNFYGITAITSNDVWAVGSVQHSSYPYQTLETMHWDGSAWTVIPAPQDAIGYPSFFGVTAVSSRDVWAVGQVSLGGNDNSEHYNAIAEHWDGSQWSMVPAYSIGYRPSYLIGVTALSSSNVWSVGQSTCRFGQICTVKTLIEHWNGTAWQLVNSPVMGVSVTLNSIVQIPGTGQLLTAGTYQSAVHVPYQTLIEMCY